MNASRKVLAIFTLTVIVSFTFLKPQKANACVDPETVVNVTCYVDSGLTEMTIVYTNLKLHTSTPNTFCSCGLSDAWTGLFSDIHSVAFVEAGTTNPIWGFGQPFTASADASAAWAALSGNWQGFISQVTQAGLTPNAPVELIVNASVPPGFTISLIDTSLRQTSIGSDVFDANTNSLAYAHLWTRNPVNIEFVTVDKGCLKMFGVKLPEAILLSSEADNTLCEDDEITFTAVPPGYSDYRFYHNGQVAQNTGSNTYLPAIDNNDLVRVLPIDDGCPGYFSEAIVTNTVILPEPYFTTTVTSTNVNDAAPIPFVNLSTGGTSWVWDFGDENSSPALNPNHTYTEAGIYDVSLTATNDEGCDKTIVFEDLIEVTDEQPGLYVPNAFTPNGDARNDVFQVYQAGSSHKQWKMQIFDRWGTLVYETADATQGWDGRYNGKVLNPGVFVYQVWNSKDIDDRTVGDVTLLR